MSNHKELQALVEFSGSRGVLSVYLDTDLSAQSKDAIKLVFRELVKDLDSSANEDVEALQRFLEFEYDWQSRGLAVFASGDELWRVVPLPISVASQAWYTSRPYLPLLTDIVDRFGEYSIALIDKESVRLFSVGWGKIQSETESYGEELKRHRQEGWYAAGYQRHEDNLALHNLKQAIEVVQDYCQRKQCRRLMLGGSADVLAQFKELAPNPLLDRVVGEFNIHMTASPAEILHRSLDIAYQTDLEEEERIVAEAITAAAKGGAGATGATDTLYALHHGRVRILLAAESFHTPGYICNHCGYLSADAHDECPICKNVEIDKTPDIVNIAIHKAIETGAKVNIVRENAMLQEAGGIAAILRY